MNNQTTINLANCKLNTRGGFILIRTSSQLIERNELNGFINSNESIEHTKLFELNGLFELIRD